MSKKVVYIDGDILPYQIGFVTQRTVYELTSEGQHSADSLLVTKSKRIVNKFVKADPDLLVATKFFVEEPIQVINTLKLAIQNIVQGSKCETFKIVLSGDSNFRDSIATIKPYKGNREGTEKPFYFEYIREWLKDKPYTIISENEEADDVISKAMISGNVGATIDKDLNNTPGLHYNFKSNTLYEVTEEEAMRNFYTQMLTGDTADNIPGIKGIGPAKAATAFANCVTRLDYEKAVHSIYSIHYKLPIKAMKEVGQLLWMRREDNEMWTPLLEGY